MSKTFTPRQNGTLVAGTTTSNVALQAYVPMRVNARMVRLVNEGPSAAFIAFGNSGVAAVLGGVAAAPNTGGMYLPVGVVEVLQVDDDVTHMAAIVATGAATIRISSGEGT